MIEGDGSTAGQGLSQERLDLLDTLGKHRMLLRLTTRDLTDAQAALRPTASELCIGGLIKHVAATEASWVDFALSGPSGMGGSDDWEAYANQFRMLPGETLQGLLDRYEEVAARTDDLVRTAVLDDAHPLPEAPWFEPGARWTARRVFQHIIAETAQHAGHADILRETIDGAKSMG